MHQKQKVISHLSIAGTATLALYEGTLALALGNAAPHSAATPILGTPYYGALLMTQLSGVHLFLTQSTVRTTDTTLVIALSLSEQTDLLAQIYAAGPFSPMSLIVAGTSLAVTYACE